jgi:hypothetical protein
MAGTFSKGVASLQVSLTLVQISLAFGLSSSSVPSPLPVHAVNVNSITVNERK